MKSILPTVMDLSRQASLRGGAAPARSRQPVAALFIQDNELRSACPASTEPLVACAGYSYACSHGLPHSQDSPPLRSTPGYPTPRYDSSSHPGSVGTPCSYQEFLIIVANRFAAPSAFARRGVFRRRGGGSPASEERKFAGVRGARSATRRLAEGNG